MKQKISTVALALALAMAGALIGVAAAPATTSLDEREAALAAQLRCVVCQNQTVAESGAPIAKDMRKQIRLQLEQGRSNDEVVAFFEQRYGSFVRYNPPWRASTWLLWLAPFAVTLVGLWVLLRSLRGQRSSSSRSAMTDVERQRVQDWLHGKHEEPHP